MAIQQVIPVSVVLQGDGVATVFTFALVNLYQVGGSPANPFAAAGVPPSSVFANNPPVPVTSATVDANGNITITLTSALGNGVSGVFQFDLAYNSGASISASPAQAMAVREVKDSGRTQVTLYVDSISAITTEALATLNITKGNVAQATATSYTVTAGKTLRIQQLTLAGIPANNTQIATRARVRVAASGITVASPVIINALSPGANNQSFTAEPVCLDFPDGLEVAGGNQIAISHIASSTVVGSTTTGAGVTFCLIGYEY
jgi:hypothetical protein